eukprot:CAMPEP_0169089848 /NCGR_PEP_ID=MMETSP1015-20121227/15508_1 /TAXON_ID=342587 /ORGANISM="Karlodinium micrum, Strain CCMP2283" /LENGTH=225 /DNA_ID=CAMNT_0009150221 /DNA_START=149 /DNA_END=823 /DNA_ORIENTATION=+
MASDPAHLESGTGEPAVFLASDISTLHSVQAFEVEGQALEGTFGGHTELLTSGMNSLHLEQELDEQQIDCMISKTPRSFASETSTFHLMQVAEQPERTTVQLRNFPKEYTRDMLLDLLIGAGFGFQFCFVYLPIDFTFGGCLGYADICMVSPSTAMQLQVCFANKEINDKIGTFVIETGWSEREGLDELISRYRDSPVMHRSVCDAHRPALFQGGRRIKFPPPTR